MSDWNDQVIEEFRANAGTVGGPLGSANMVLVHHVGRRSGARYVTPLRWFEAGPDSICVTSSKVVDPHPDWYQNLVAAEHGSVEVGRDGGISAHDVRVWLVPDGEREQVMARVVAEMSADPHHHVGAAETLPANPVLELIRSSAPSSSDPDES